MKIVGLTGGIASGKSTVSAILEKHNVPIVDADRVAREVVEPGRPAWKAIVREFGEGVLKSNRELDRDKLGQIIFADATKRAVLNRCTHPFVFREMLKQIAWHFLSGKRLIVLDVPLLFETGKALRMVNETLVVYCTPAVQLQRLMERNQLSEEDARQRIAAQMPLDEKRRRADRVIDNSGTREELVVNVLEALEAMTPRFTLTSVHVALALAAVTAALVWVWK